ncbi:mitochondrial ribosomal 8 [Fusarium circinatum]|uniref:Mitochondrial ribosomal 8 n=2 Tax=Fusarium fujikuroi species complex TaxID=171627 RepID=A0A8H5LGH2_GIBSU|nr:mitochondrial ribosomal 8 [Fusarium subglutinans]KAF5590435.1 mitochondrial ribosomal 8 [Fusarium subglutinans]KAF5684793.1 mitochondrial ribosomal 8 [Fusarium circinatum]
MAGGTVKYRHLSRNSAARVALLRGLVTQLVQFEHIHTTYAKAKEAQRMAEKLITLAKRDNEPARRSAQGILYTPTTTLPKLLGELRNRYLTREGGYTRVVRTESKNTYDQGESAILEFVDGPKDSRFMMTAKTVARDRMLGQEHTPVTRTNIKKVTQFRGEVPFEEMVRRFMVLKTGEKTGPSRDESSLAEVEAEKAADKNAEQAKEMAAGIVPESVRKAAQQKNSP